MFLIQEIIVFTDDRVQYKWSNTCLMYIVRLVYCFWSRQRIQPQLFRSQPVFLSHFSDKVHNCIDLLFRDTCRPFLFRNTFPANNPALFIKNFYIIENILSHMIHRLIQSSGPG